MTRAGPVDGRQFLDCPVSALALDVTDEWRNPSRGGGSWITHRAAAEYLDKSWTEYQRAAAPLGYDDRIKPEGDARALVCQGCGAVVRVWLRGNPVSVPSEGIMGVPVHRRRAIDVVAGSSARRGRCGGACLGGKRSCDCQCGGYCHGAGTCHCAERTRAEREHIDAIAAGAPHAERLVFTGGGGTGYACGDCGAEEGTPHPAAAPTAADVRPVAGELTNAEQHRLDYPGHARFSSAQIDRWESFGGH